MFNAGVRGKRAKDGVGFLSTAEQFNQKNYLVPTVTSFSITDVSYVPLDNTAVDTAGGETIVINGSGFAPGATVQVGATTIGSVTYIDQNRLAFAAPALSSGSYTIYVTNSNGGTGILVSGLVYSGLPTYSTSAGSLGTIYETANINTAVVATGDAPITYTLLSGTLPSGATLNSNGTITGNAPVDGSSTTYSFTIQASDAQLQDTTRSFSLTISTDVVTWSTPAADYAYTLDGNLISNVSLSAASAAGYNITYSANTLPTGISLSGNTIFGTPTVEQTVYTALTATAATTGRSATRYVSWSVALGDAFLKNTTLLLTGQTLSNTTFIKDASTNNFASTTIGDVKPSGMSPYTPGYYSNYFDGTGDYLTTTYTSVGSSNFCAEMWVLVNNVSANRYFFSQSNASVGSNADIGFAVLSTTASKVAFYWNVGTTQTSVTSTNTLNMNQWNHVAAVRNGSTFTIYLNGVATSTTSSGTINVLSSTPKNYIGYFIPEGNSTAMVGYLSNLRLVIGNSVYTANFTPPTTPLTAIANTSLLTCQSNRFIDISTNAFTVTANDNTSIKSFQPFTPNTSYSDYGSAYFDGTGDAINAGSQTAYAFGTGPFCIEGWIYNNVLKNYSCLVTTRPDNGNYADAYHVGWDSAGGLSLYVNTTPRAGAPNGTMKVGVWQHFVCCRDVNNVTSIFVNGVRVGTETITTNFSRSLLGIGDFPTTQGECHNGYISNLRLVKGYSVYDPTLTTLTVPTSPLTAITGTSLLTLQNKQPINNKIFLDNSSNNILLTRSNNVSQGSFSSYGGNWSNYFSSSDIYAPANSAWNFTGNFTLEFWTFIPASSSTSNSWVLQALPSSTYFAINITAGTGVYVFLNGSSPAFTCTDVYPTVNTWNHVALVRNSGVFKLYVNGVASTTTYSSASTVGNGSYPMYVANGGIAACYISNFRIVNGTAVYTSNFTPSTTPLTSIANTVLLTCQSNRLIDNSPNNFSLKTDNAVTVQRFSPFNPSSVTPTSYSGYFDGSGDWLSSSTWTSAGQFGTGDFTVECWVYATGAPNSNQVIWGCNSYPNTTGLFLAYYGGSSTNLGLRSGSTTLIDSSSGWALNTWLHVAVVRSSGTLTLYINGTSRGSTTFTNNCTDGLQYIGRPSDVGNYTMQGYISNFRIVKGTAVYTSSFTPSTTPITAISNTSLLTCQSSGFIDNSTNNYTISATGNTQPTIQNPFGYTSSLTNGYTANTVGGSAYFDGSGDYLTTPNNTTLSIGTGDFTFESWIYPTAFNTWQSIISSRPDNGSYSNAWCIGVNTTGYPYIYSDAMQVTGNTSNASITLNKWHHLAVSRSNSAMKIFINGVQDGSNTTSQNYSAAVYTIGSNLNGSEPFTGYISDSRLIKGQALYTSNFVPPAEPLSSIQNTVLLNNFTDAAIIDYSTQNNLETAGDVKISTSVSKFGGSSLYFDGSGDYLYVPHSNVIDIGGSNFTVECWAYSTNISGLQYQNIFSKKITTGTTNVGYSFSIKMNGSVAVWNGSTEAVTTGITLASNTWYHLAWVISGTTLKIFVNGVQYYSSTYSTSTNTYPATVGCGSYGGSFNDFFAGYIDDLRITKGYARYTSNFTAPTTTFKIK